MMVRIEIRYDWALENVLVSRETFTARERVYSIALGLDRSAGSMFAARFRRTTTSNPSMMTYDSPLLVWFLIAFSRINFVDVFRKKGGEPGRNTVGFPSPILSFLFNMKFPNAFETSQASLPLAPTSLKNTKDKKSKGNPKSDSWGYRARGITASPEILQGSDLGKSRNFYFLFIFIFWEGGGRGG